MSPIYVNRKGEFDLKTMYSALSPLNNPTSDRSSSTADNPLVDPFWLICECCVLRSRSYRSQQVKHVRIMQIPPGETCADHADHTRGMQRNSIVKQEWDWEAVPRTDFLVPRFLGWETQASQKKFLGPKLFSLFSLMYTPCHGSLGVVRTAQATYDGGT